MDASSIDGKAFCRAAARGEVALVEALLLSKLAGSSRDVCHNNNNNNNAIISFIHSLN